jgi:hypothetical protein
MKKTYRFRRFIAIAIDWNLAGLPCLILSALLMPLVKKGLSPALVVPIMLPMMLTFPLLFLYRDRLFKGRSPGNRLMKLTILDRRTLQPLPKNALVTRNLFFLMGGIDLFALTLTGSTLGDRAVAALVVPLDKIPAEPPRREPVTGKTFLKGALVAAMCIALFIGIIFLALETVKDEPHYAAAHIYLLKSEAFAQLGAAPDDARLTGFSLNSTTRNSVAETEACFTFQVKGRSLTVICHPQGENWYVCPDCTKFR